MSDELELAWAAGFWDGEGCTYASTKGEVRLSITQCNRDHLERFASAVGYGNINGPYNRDNERQRPFWQWRVQGLVALKVMGRLLPYLSLEKRRQFERIRDREGADGQLSLIHVK